MEHTAEPAAERKPEEPTIEPVRHLFEADRQELLAELKQILRDLETLRTVPQDDPIVRQLTADVRQTITRAATNSPTCNSRRRTFPVFVSAPDRE
jgi:hypothetical protein